MSEPWGPPPPDQMPPPGPPPPGPPPPPPEDHHADRDHDGVEDRYEHHDRSHHDHHGGGYAGGYGGGHYGGGYGGGYGQSGGMGLREQVRTRFGRGIAVGDLLSWLDFRVTELHGALLEGDRHPSRVPGSPVRMSGLDAVLNTDATAFRTLTELGARLDRLEEKVDLLLSRLPER